MQTSKRSSGVSLLEVLAAMFVISIGLLGVLAVIPFGAFQVSKAKHAEHASNMLANAAEEIFVRKMVGWGFNTPSGPRAQVAPPQTRSITSPPNIQVTTVTTELGKSAKQTITEEHTTIVTATPYKEAFIECFGEMVLMRIVIEIEGTCTIKTTKETVPDDSNDPPIPSQESTVNISYQSKHSTHFAFNCTRFLWFEPRESGAFPPDAVHIFPLSSFQPEQARKDLIKKWVEPMRGQDDLDYTTYADKRPDFAEQQGKIQSSGKYNWFFTLIPSPVDDWKKDTTVNINETCGCRFHVPFAFEFTIPLGRDMVLVNDVDGIAAQVDIIACYNRVPDDDRQVSIPSERFVPSRGGGTLTLPDSTHLELFTQTKYVLVSWKESSKTRGAWCKIVFVDKDELSNIGDPKIVVMGNLPNMPVNNMHVYIPSGVLYHKRLEDVPIR